MSLRPSRVGSNENFTKFDTKFSRAPQAAKFHEICAVTVLDPTYTLDITPHKGECGPHRHTRSYTAAVRDTSTRTRVACATAAADAAASASAHAHAPTHGHRTPPHTTRAHSSYLIHRRAAEVIVARRSSGTGLCRRLRRELGQLADELLLGIGVLTCTPRRLRRRVAVRFVRLVLHLDQVAVGHAQVQQALGGLKREREREPCVCTGLPLTGWCVGSYVLGKGYWGTGAVIGLLHMQQSSGYCMYPDVCQLLRNTGSYVYAKFTRNFLCQP